MNLVKYFLLGAASMALLLLAWKILLILGACGLVYLVFQAGVMDWSGYGDGRQRPSNE